MSQIKDVGEIFVAASINCLTCIADIARCWQQGGGKQSHQCCFTAAIWAFNLDNFTPTNPKVDLLEDIAIIAFKEKAFDYEKGCIGQQSYPRLISLGIMPKIRIQMLSLEQLVNAVAEA